MKRSTDEWVEFLTKQFSGTPFAIGENGVNPADAWGWCAAGVSPDDDDDDVSAAWKEACDEEF